MTLLRPPSERTREAETAPSPEVLFKEARRRRHRRWGIGSLAAAALAAVAAVALSAAGPPSPPRRPARPHEEHAPSSAPAALPSMAWQVRPVASTPSVRSVVATKTVLYWLTGPASDTCHSGATVPVRFDPTSSTDVRGAPFAVCDVQQLVAAGRALWALEFAGTTIDVASLDPRTLAATKTMSFPETGAAISETCGSDHCAALAAGSQTVLWLTTGRQIWRLAASSGAVERQFTPVSSAVVLAPSPTGLLLYTSGKNPTGAGAVVDEYATSSGHLLAATSVNCAASGPTALAAGPGVAWASCRGGNASYVHELSSKGLALVTPPRTPPRTPGPVGPFSHVGTIGITTNGGPLWLRPVGLLACADPATGTVLAKMSFPYPIYGSFGPLVVAGGHIYSTLPSYAAGTYHAHLYSVAAPKACFAG